MSKTRFFTLFALAFLVGWIVGSLAFSASATPLSVDMTLSGLHSGGRVAHIELDFETGSLTVPDMAIMGVIVDLTGTFDPSSMPQHIQSIYYNPIPDQAVVYWFFDTDLFVGGQGALGEQLDPRMPYGTFPGAALPYTFIADPLTVGSIVMTPEPEGLVLLFMLAMILIIGWRVVLAERRLDTLEQRKP